MIWAWRMGGIIPAMIGPCEDDISVGAKVGVLPAPDPEPYA